MRKHHVFRLLSGLVVLGLIGVFTSGVPDATYADEIIGVFTPGEGFVDLRGASHADDCGNIPVLQKKARAGNVEAQKQLAECYSEGRGVAKDVRRAVEWLHKAAEQGDAEAQNVVGTLYDKGAGGVSKDERRAVEWFSKAAKQGDATAQYNLGVMYGHGRGVPKDERRAAALYRQAAEQGIADAQYNLGNMYNDGRGGLPKDERRAAEWYCRAAEQGDTLAATLAKSKCPRMRGR